jgi:hypothetical protein
MSASVSGSILVMEKPFADFVQFHVRAGADTSQA